MRLLVVEDSASQAARLQKILEGNGYEVSVATRGSEAISLIERGNPDLVLLDLKLPDCDGFELCRKIKESAPDRFLPIIIVTVLKDLKDKVKGLDAGADDYLIKPFDSPELLARVAAMLRIKTLNEEALKRSVTDSLTGLYNRRFLERRLREELKSSQRTGLSVSCVEIDVDHFKAINDRLGHAVGDRVLKELAEVFQKNRRQEDVVARYGGEEFVIVLRVCNIEQGVAAAQRLRKAIESRDWAALGIPEKVTVSCGVSSFPVPVGNPTASVMIQAADDAMYRAKKLGRNRVCAYDPSLS